MHLKLLTKKEFLSWRPCNLPTGLYMTWTWTFTLIWSHLVLSQTVWTNVSLCSLLSRFPWPLSLNRGVNDVVLEWSSVLLLLCQIKAASSKFTHSVYSISVFFVTNQWNITLNVHFFNKFMMKLWTSYTGKRMDIQTEYGHNTLFFRFSGNNKNEMTEPLK